MPPRRTLGPSWGIATQGIVASRVFHGKGVITILSVLPSRWGGQRLAACVFPSTVTPQIGKLGRQIRPRMHFHLCARAVGGCASHLLTLQGVQSIGHAAGTT